MVVELGDAGGLGADGALEVGDGGFKLGLPSAWRWGWGLACGELSRAGDGGWGLIGGDGGAGVGTTRLAG